MDFTDYSGLGDTGFESKQVVAPEDEDFHAAYIAGMTRTNHINVTEQAGRLQVRGVEYNLDDIYMVITHVKRVLTKTKNTPQGDKVECFSYKTPATPPWFGYNNKQCGDNSAARAADAFCNTCREQIIVSGIYCEPTGKPRTNKDGKPIFVFLRAKGMKYSNVADYLSALANDDIEPPIFNPITNDPQKERQRANFEKIAVNNKRFVTVIGIGTADSAYGQKMVFTLDRGPLLASQDVMNVLKLSKQTLEKFNDKFDWSQQQQTSTGYAPPQQGAPAQQPVSQDNLIPDAKQAPVQNTTQSPAQQAPPAQQSSDSAPQGSFNFEDLDF